MENDKEELTYFIESLEFTYYPMNLKSKKSKILFKQIVKDSIKFKDQLTEVIENLK